MPDDPLKEAFDLLDDPPVGTLGPAIRARAAARQRKRRTPRIWLAAAIVALAGLGATVALLALRGPGDGLGAGRWRGEVDRADALELSYVIEGDGALDAAVVRPVEPRERIIFTVRTDADTYLCIDEQGDGAWERIYPVGEEGWFVTAGRHWPGGEEPLSFGTEYISGVRAYRVLSDPENADCSEYEGQRQVEVYWQ